jgi:N-methylhydantoinase B/oxoprolinase/acetone carboxylase alpha subunit
MKSGIQLRHYDCLRVEMPGGGFGTPLERDASLVLADLFGRKVSLEQARVEWDVVIHDSALDLEATAPLRRPRS